MWTANPTTISSLLETSSSASKVPSARSRWGATTPRSRRPKGISTCSTISRVISPELFNGENRLKNYIGYITPAFGKSFHVTVNFFPGEDPASGNNGVADSSSLSLDYETDLLYVAVAHDWDIDGEGVETLRLVGGYTFGPARVMLLYQQTDTGFVDEDGFGASLAWTFGKNTAKVQYLTADIWRIDPQADPLENLYESVFSVGLDHELGEDTKLFGFYTTGDIGGTDESNNYIAIGIEHNF